MAIQIPAIIGAIIGALGGLLKLADNPVIAYFLVLGILFLDTLGSDLIGGALGYKGAIGFFVSWVLGFLGVPFQVTSFQLMVVFAILPVFIWALDHSRSK